MNFIPKRLVIFIILNFVFAFNSNTQVPSSNNKFTIEGEPPGVDVGMVILNYRLQEKLIVDSSKISGNLFHFSGAISKITKVLPAST